jgi:hypothetical protein
MRFRLQILSTQLIIQQALLLQMVGSIVLTPSGLVSPARRVELGVEPTSLTIKTVRKLVDMLQQFLSQDRFRSLVLAQPLVGAGACAGA